MGLHASFSEIAKDTIFVSWWVWDELLSDTAAFQSFPLLLRNLTKRLLLSSIKTHWFTDRLWCYCRVKVWAPFWVWKATNPRAFLPISELKFHQSLGLPPAQDLKSQHVRPRNIHPGTIPLKKLYISLFPTQFPGTSPPSWGRYFLVSFQINFLSVICEVCCAVWRCGVPWVPAAQIPFSLELQYFHWGNLSPKGATQLLWTHSFPLWGV